METIEEIENRIENEVENRLESEIEAYNKVIEDGITDYIIKYVSSRKMAGISRLFEELTESSILGKLDILVREVEIYTYLHVDEDLYENGS